MKNKTLGQFFTEKNVFKNKAFLDWFQLIDEASRKTILEPFAGKNGLIDMLKDLKLLNSFKSFDIEPHHEDVQQNDSILNFPTGFDLCITNPPFLAKNVASRKKIPVFIEPFSDLYEKCLDACLRNCNYVAAIVPESFIVSPFFKSRLFAVVSLPEKFLFQHTEHPVCLALFNPNKTEDFLVYKEDQCLGYYHQNLKEINQWFNILPDFNIVFHDKNGELGLFNIDATNIEKKIHFDLGELINPKDVGYHARLRTRIKILNPNNQPLTKAQLKSFIKICNKVLNQYREKTNDVFLTSFKGLRSDGNYRRRLDYSTARLIVAKAYSLHFKWTN